jgi:hypothetical protein
MDEEKMEEEIYSHGICERLQRSLEAFKYKKLFLSQQGITEHKIENVIF